MTAGSEPTFEEAQQELESIVERLERGTTTLDEALALWERGEALHRLCVARLDELQGRIEELAARGRTSSAAPAPADGAGLAAETE